MDGSKDVLAHYGVKGMQWGVRRTQAQLAKARAQRAEKRAAQERTRFVGGKKDAPISLSDDELNSRITRMEREKKYLDLNKRDLSTGEKLATEIVSQAGKNTASKVAAGALTLAVGLAVKKKMGDSPEANKVAQVLQRGGLKK